MILPDPPADGDWPAWSRQSVRELHARGLALQARHGLDEGTPYQWDLDASVIRFDAGRVELRLVCVGTTAPDGTFLWGWANETHPEASRSAMEQVRIFGQRHGLGLLMEPMWEGGHAEALEMLAISGSVLDAQGYWVEPDPGLYFLLFEDEPT